MPRLFRADATATFAALSVAVWLLGTTPAAAQPRIPKSSIPADMPAEVKEQVEKLYSSDPQQRAEGVGELEAMGKDAAAAAPFLVGLLSDHERIDPENAYSGSVAGCAISALTEMGRPAVPPLIAALKDNDEATRRRAAYILASIGDRRAVLPLIASLKAPDGEVRSWAISALHDFKDPRAVKPLIEALKDDDRDVRSQALWALQAIEDPTAVDGLIGVLKSGDSDLRAGAAQALGRLKAPQATDSLIVAIEDEDNKVRVTAAVALAELGNSRAVEPLIAALQDKQSSGPGSGAVWALAKLKDPRAVEPLITALKEKEKLAPTVAAALRYFGKDPRVVEALLAALNNNDEKVRQHAASALGSIGEVRAVEPLIAALRDSEPDVRLYAAKALGGIKDPRALDPLLAAYDDDPIENVRWNARRALNRLGYRDWSDRDGNLVGKAAFVDLKDGAVILKEPGGNTIRIALEELAPSDQRNAKSRAAEKQGTLEEFKAEAAKKAAEERAKYDKRIAELTEAIRRDPTSPEAYVNRAMAWESTDEYECEQKAIPDLDKAVELDPDRAETYLARGIFWSDKSHDEDKAIAEYRKALKLDPESTEVRRRLAKAYAQRAFGEVGWADVVPPDIQKALSDCNEALRLDPRCSIAYSSRAMAWLRAEKNEKAIADYTEALRLAPKQAWDVHCRGLLWWEEGQLDKAIVDFTESARLDPRNERAYINRGSIRQLKGEYQKALADYAKAIQIKPRDPKAYRSRAWLLAACPDAKFRDGPQAVADAKYAVKQARWDEFAYYSTLAAAYAGVGEFKNAVLWQQKAIDSAAKEPESVDDAAMQSLRARLELYNSGKPYRQ